MEVILLLAQVISPTDCHPNYSECLPIVEDLNCSDIEAKNFQVIGGSDPYRLDQDGDGIACESNQGGDHND